MIFYHVMLEKRFTRENVSKPLAFYLTQLMRLQILTWFISLQDEFCTYMQLEYTEKEDSYFRAKEVYTFLYAGVPTLLVHSYPHVFIDSPFY